jgi:predicted nuclease of predicted toxin-antitoxin system
MQRRVVAGTISAVRAQLSFLHGAPPKVVWLSVGNATTDAIASLLEHRREDIEAFDASSEESLLVVERDDVS